MSEDVLETLVDKYSVKILSLAMGKPVTVQGVSDLLDIPPATCYRKFNELVERGLLIEMEKVLVEKQKRRTLYISTLRELKIEITPRGVKIDWKEKEKPVKMWDIIKSQK